MNCQCKVKLVIPITEWEVLYIKKSVADIGFKHRMWNVEYRKDYLRYTYFKPEPLFFDGEEKCCKG
jgi:hypothetical protein